MLPVLPVIVGPTASGKSSLAVRLAERLHRAHAEPPEVLAADSMQVYRRMDIGTAKPTAHQRRGFPHRLIDLVDPTEHFSVDQWLQHARDAIDHARARHADPIVAGGSMLYAQALLFGLFRGPDPDPQLRQQLHAMHPDERRAELQRVDPHAAARIHPNDDRRTVRALEVHRLTGVPISEHQRQWSAKPRADALPIVLRPDTALNNRRINARVRAMIDAGLVDEAHDLWQTGRLGPQAREGLGYKQLADHFEGRLPLEDAIERIKIETRRFAKNQRTWLRRIAATPGAITLDPDAPSDAADAILRAIDQRARQSPPAG